MLEALIPYVMVPELTLFDSIPFFGFVKLRLFGPLVLAGLIAGCWRSLVYARRVDIDQPVFTIYLVSMLVSAFCVAHWVCVLLYFPHQLAHDPGVLLQIFNGLSSVGGFFGGLVGGWLYLRIYCARQPEGAQPMGVFTDASVFGWLTGWCFGRAACSLVHDHPSRVVAEGTFMAVGPWPDGSWRYDLGLLELLFTIALMLIVQFVLRRVQWPPGRLTGLVLVAYAPFRFFLESLRADEPARGVIIVPDARYLGLTPAQWFAFGFLGLGVWLLLRKPTAAQLGYAKDSDRQRRVQAANPTQGQ